MKHIIELSEKEYIEYLSLKENLEKLKSKESLNLLYKVDCGDYDDDYIVLSNEETIQILKKEIERSRRKIECYIEEIKILQKQKRPFFKISL